MANDLRIGGLISGMDTQAEIDKIMKYSRAPLNRLKQQQQMLIWKQEAYRAQNTALTKLRDLLTNLKLSSSYRTKIAKSTDEKVASATANSRASGSYRVHVEELAQAAQNRSSQAVAIRTKMTGERISGTVDISTSNNNNKFSIFLNDEKLDITIDDGTYTAEQLAANIQTKINGLDLNEPVYVKATDDGNIVFYTRPNSIDGSVQSIALKEGAGSTLTALGFVDGANSKELFGNAISSGTILVNNTNKQFKITIVTSAETSATQEITLSLDNGVHTLADVAGNIQSQLTALSGVYANVKVTVTDSNQLKFTYIDTAHPENANTIKLSPGSANDILQEMGFGTGAASEARNSIDTSASIWNQRDKFINYHFFDDKIDEKPTDPSDPKYNNKTDFSFVINGQAFTFKYTDTINTIIAEINGNAAAGVTAYYDTFNDKLIFTSIKVGDNNENGAEIQLSDPDGILNQLFGIDQSNEDGGTNAQLTINGIPIQQKDNNFTFNNVTFNLTGKGDTTVTVSSNSDDITKKIKDFIDKYNEVIDALNTELTESRASSGNKYSYYEPLTDDQRKEMSQDQIKAWEDKAKEGILHNDSLLSGVLYEIRTSLSRMISNPISITGLSIADTVDLTGANKFKITFNGITKDIVLDEKSYTRDSNKDELKSALQTKFDLAFGTGAIIVDRTGSGALKFTTNNFGFTFNDADSESALSQLGLGDGATVKAGYSSLSQIGITTGYYTENGKLYFDEEKFAAAMADDPDSVIRMLTNFDAPDTVKIDPKWDLKKQQQTINENNSKIAKSEVSKGIFYKLYEIIQQSNNKIADMAGSVGTVGSSSLGQQLSRLGDKIDTVQDRLTQEEDRLWSQFTAMEQALSRLNSQSSYLSSILGMSSGG